MGAVLPDDGVCDFGSPQRPEPLTRWYVWEPVRSRIRWYSATWVPLCTEVMVQVTLPAPIKAPLSRSPLRLVVCQVRFEETVAVSDAKLVLGLHEDLGGRGGPYPKLESIRGTRVEIPMAAAGPIGVPSETGFAGWRMSSSEWIVTIMPDSVALETSRYTSWDDDFRPRLAQLIDAVAGRISPTTEQRLGLRYVDRVTEPTVSSPHGWREYISEPFLGPIVHPTVGRHVRNSQQQTVLTLDDGFSALVRTGFALEGDTESDLAYLLDFDVFRSDVRAFEVESILTGAEALHDINIRLFQQAVTKKLLEALT